MPDPLHPEGGSGQPKPSRPNSGTKLWLGLVVLIIVGSIVGGVVLAALWVSKSVTKTLARRDVAVPVRQESAAKATPVAAAAREPVTKSAAPTTQPVLRITSTKPASPAALKLGERMNVAIQYENPGPGSVQIWAQPWTRGKLTSGAGMNPSHGYAPGRGEAEGWFILRTPGEVDEVRVNMVNARDGKLIASAKLPIRGVWAGGTPLESAASAPASQPPVLVALDREGAFGFPQKEARVLCDNDDLRFSVWNNGEHFLAQAILWRDGDAATGVTKEGRQTGDLAILHFDLGGEFAPSPTADRKYNLSTWPTRAGMDYQARASKSGWTPGKDDSKGRGAIRYATMPNGTKARVDTFVIPLGELGGAPGKTLRLAYWGKSPNPDLIVNSTGFASASGIYYSYSIPVAQYHGHVLETGRSLDVNQLPKTSDVPPGAMAARLPQAAQATKPVQPAGPSEGEMLDIKFTAMDGREVDLAKMKGKVVLIDFWATWCGPCVAELPHVLDAYSKFHDKGFEIVGISFDSDRAKLERMMSEKGMTWPQFFDGTGWKNEFGQRYGIRGIPTMWLVNKEGKLASKNCRRDLAAQVEKLLAEP